MTAILRRAARRDLNEAAIVNTFRELGCIVVPLSMQDIPDLLVGYLKRWHLCEVKYENATLSPGQALWHDAAATAGERPLVIRTEAHARKAVTTWTREFEKELTWHGSSSASQQ
jgi:hypothetical protein